MYRINEIKLSLGESKDAIPGKIKQKLKLNENIENYKIVRESIDARDKGEIQFVYTVDFETQEENPKLVLAPDHRYELPSPGTQELKKRPVIVGFGPCGIFAALILSELGYRPLVVERGRPVEDRTDDVERFWREGILDEESNVQFGEGGAGTFSDGKLTTGTKNVRQGKVLEALVSAGAGEEILYKQKPHIGTDILKKVVVHLREKILQNGGEILFNTRLEDVLVDDKGRVSGVLLKDVRSEQPSYPIDTEVLVLAIGHSARDTIRTLHGRGVLMEQKPFSIGVRIEHPQKMINEAQYGKKYAALLPPADYKLAHRCGNGRGVYSFCMCPGGEVITASSQKSGVVINGMSNSARDGEFANSGLLVDVRVSDFSSEDPLAGVAFQEQYEQIAFKKGGSNYKAPKTTWRDFAHGTEVARPVIESLPDFAVESLKEAMPHFARKIRGFDLPEAKLTAVESRSSSPVRIARGEDLESSIKGLYPGGEGAGYAGGIVSAAVDGILIAEKIVSIYIKKDG